jgi:hypothetical protein
MLVGMRQRVRTANEPGTRARAVPARSRMSVRRGSQAPLVRSSQLAAALRTSREALTDLQGQLDTLLAALRDSSAAPEAGLADRLHGTTCRAGAAIAELGTLARQR